MITEHLTEDDVDAIRCIAYCCSTDEERPQLTMVQLSDGYAFATDSYRLAAIELPDFINSPIPKWVSPLALPERGGCRLDYELVEVKENETSTATRAINGQPWPFAPMNKLDFWRHLTTGFLTARLTIGDAARVAIVEQIAAWWKDKTLRRHGGPEEAAVAVTRSGFAVQLATANASVAIADDVSVPDEYGLTNGCSPDAPLLFNSKYFSQLLRYAPPGDVDLQMHGQRAADHVIHFRIGPAVIQLDDEIHALMPIRATYEVNWNPTAIA